MATPIISKQKYCKYKECYKCGDKGHPASYCKTKLYSNVKKNNKKNKKKYDNSSSMSRKSSTHTMVGKMKKDLQKTKK